MPRAKGFDTSRHNHPNDLPINFQAAFDAGYSFWAGRLSVGNYYIDPWIAPDYEAAGHTPMVRLVYHVPRAYLPTAGQIAKIHEGLALLGEDGPDGLVMDVETDKALGKRAVTVCLGEHLQDILTWFEGRVILYTNLDYLLNFIDFELLATYLPEGYRLDLWIAWPAAGGAYNTNDDPPVESWVLYQRSWTHAIPGHPDQTVDLDEFNGDETELFDYFFETEEPPVATILENIAEVKSLLAQAAVLLDVIEQQAQEQPAPEPPPPPPPPPSTDVTIRITADPRANARYYRFTNANGRPIMIIYPSDTAPTSERIQFGLGTLLKALPGKVLADGGMQYWQLTERFGRAGETLFVRELDAVLA